MALLRNISRILLGIVFIFSGFVKGIDPIGSEYKFTDYFLAFGMPWLTDTALWLAIILAATEFIIGIALLLNIKTKRGIWGALLFMIFFTPLTLVLALTNPVSDCGCFGDAWVISNWETFSKNIVLLILAIIAFTQRNKFQAYFHHKEGLAIIIITLGSFIGMELYSLKHLPFLDFRPYALGKNINNSMQIPEDASYDEYQVNLMYKNKNTGELKEFTEDNYPWQDTVNWVYHSSNETLIKEGYKAPIASFFVEHPTLGDISNDILQDDDYSFLVISYNINKAKFKYQKNINKLAEYANEKGYNFYGLSASLTEDIQTYKATHNVLYDYCSTDEIQLKTIIRSNPGLILLHKGTIIGKWAGTDVPKIDDLKNKELNSFCLDQQREMKDVYIVWLIIMAYTIFLLSYIVITKNKRKL